MNKTCARCEKTVYPTEELKCLDKTWHKGCFKCQECGMTLNMRTYKGYGKLPYCESHVPKAKHTTMAETPELKRIAENTKIQSNVKYHADFEKSKGKFTQVADDPETLRIKANTKIISNVAYHGDLEKKAQMEKQRQINENGELVDVASDNYHQQLENYATEMLPPTSVPNLPPKNHYQTPTTNHGGYQSPNRNYKQETYKPDQYEEYKEQNQNKQEYHHTKQDYNQTKEYNQTKQEYHQTKQEYHQNRQEFPNPPPQYTDQYYRQPQQPRYEDYHNQVAPPPQQTYVQQKYDEYQNQYAYGQYTTPGQNYGVGSQQKIGRIQDYDPLSDGPRAVPNTQRASATLIYNSDPRKAGAHQPSQPTQSRHIGRYNTNQRVYIAMYDYQANDSDEVSFREGDLISNVTSIDEGWMTGQVLRTGRTGMLPANYVELANNTH
ncbi:nebulin repeat domain-containing protein [Phthorimaea operculella]|nr:nebulin repeat domain-containing protein [Phthorimaea operculella]